MFCLNGESGGPDRLCLLVFGSLQPAEVLFVHFPRFTNCRGSPTACRSKSSVSLVATGAYSDDVGTCGDEDLLGINSNDFPIFCVLFLRKRSSASEFTSAFWAAYTTVLVSSCTGKLIFCLSLLTKVYFVVHTILSTYFLLSANGDT